MERFHLHLETARTRPTHLQLKEETWHAAAARHPELAKRLDVTIGWGGDILDDALKTADFMLNHAPPRERLRERAPRLRWIQTTGAGLDAILPLDWLPAGVTLTNNKGAHGPKAEDSCTLYILLIHTRFKQVAENQRQHKWSMVLTPPVAGRTAVVLGFGDLGQGAGRAAKKLGLNVIAVTRSGKAAAPADECVSVSQIDEVLPRADFLMIAAPLTAETRGLIDRRRVGMLKNGAGMINIGRAAIVDYDAVAVRLEREELAGAVFDVLPKEPLPPESPLWDTRNLIVTPHISCDMPGYIDHLFDFWFENFARFLEGKPLVNAVDPVRGY